MNCHSVLFNDASYLEPVRESYRTGKSIEWVKVHRLADFVYFNHSIHVNKGVGCSTCHGQVNQMPLVFQANTLLMQWCLDSGLRIVQQSTLMTTGWYNEPQGAWLPSIVY